MNIKHEIEGLTVEGLKLAALAELLERTLPVSQPERERQRQIIIELRKSILLDVPPPPEHPNLTS